MPNYNGINFTEGNEAEGPSLGFSLPAGLPNCGGTCPGENDWCRSFCYAQTGFHAMNIKPKQENLVVTRNANFVQKMVDAIRHYDNKPRFKKTFRITTTGDFYSIEYIKKWISIVKQMPDWIFTAFTRTWKIPKFKSSLEDLRSQPNVFLFASTDSLTGPPPKGWLESGITGYYNSCVHSCSCDCENCTDKKCRTMGVTGPYVGRRKPVPLKKHPLWKEGITLQ